MFAVKNWAKSSANCYKLNRNVRYRYVLFRLLENDLGKVTWRGLAKVVLRVGAW